MKRVAQLDSIRGLASLSLVFHHLWLSAPVLPAIFYYSTARIFFILSDFVLALPFAGGKTTTYPAYIIKRICRIYLPYLAALLIAIFATSLIHNRTEAHVDHSCLAFSILDSVQGSSPNI